MNGPDYKRRIASEFLGTAFLLMTVVGAGIMADRLADGQAGIALLTATLPTGAMLVVLILTLGPISGAHLNPAVTIAMRLRGETGNSMSLAYVSVQCLGGLAGVVIAHQMFGLPLLELSETNRSGPAQFLSEVVATFGLVASILLALEFSPTKVAQIVGLYIIAAYWFTSSTSFANPAVTLSRVLTDSYSGIRLNDAPVFIGAQIVGAVLATVIIGWLLNFDSGKPKRKSN